MRGLISHSNKMIGEIHLKGYPITIYWTGVTVMGEARQTTRLIQQKSIYSNTFFKYLKFPKKKIEIYNIHFDNSISRISTDCKNTTLSPLNYLL